MTLETSIPPPHAEWILGHNQQQQGSEVQAGARAQLIPSAITYALSTFRGRVAARSMQLLFVGRGIDLLHYLAIRPFAMMEAIVMALGDHSENALVIDPAAGYSPQMIWLAERLSQTKFLEIDPPEIYLDKKQRLQGIAMPPNLETLALDLSTQSLAYALNGQKADVIVAIGAYATPDEYVELLQALRQYLTPNGHVVGAFPYTPGIDNIKENLSIFERFIGRPNGVVHDVTELKTRFTKANYHVDHILHFNEIAQRLGKPRPVEIEIIAIAHPNDE